MDVLVVGAGEMGRWFARTLARARDIEIAFADADFTAAEAAADVIETVESRAVVLDPTDTENAGRRECFEVVCLAVPMPAVEDAIATHASRAERAILDVTGVMDEPVAAMATHASDLERVSLHPLFGAANAPGRVAVVADAPGPITDAIREALAADGNDLFETTPAEHDAAMETVQARAHTAILAFALAAEEVPSNYATPISESLADLAAQVTDGEPGVYADIQATFAGAEDVADAAERVATADREAFEALYREAGIDGEGADRTACGER